jgi:hypothetical protein
VLDRGWLALDLPLRRAWHSVVIGMGCEGDEARRARSVLAASEPATLLAAVGRRWADRWTGWPHGGGPLESIARRGLAYASGCCVIPLPDGSTCLITDHRLLPLAWTRDGYFVARAFIDWATATARSGPLDAVRRHLRWLFEVADRPDGWWARSHLIGGERKDRAFQADQQLYPLLELADYTHATGDRAPLTEHASQVPTILAVLEARADSGTGLFGTEETAADDPTDLPYQTATQILAWRTLTRLAALGLATGALTARAERVRAAVLRHLVTSVGGRHVLAHATDGRGRLVHHHDANDLPLAHAAGWGFLAPEDPLWVSTMASVLAPTHAAYFGGPYGGLGSRHTPDAWPLGHLQALIAREALDPEAVAGAVEALRIDAQWDDLLPEASDAATGRPTSRPWFAWPGCVAASVHLAAGPTRRFIVGGRSGVGEGGPGPSVRNSQWDP